MIAAGVLGLAGITLAQAPEGKAAPDTAAAAPPQGAAPEALREAGTSLILGPGTMAEAVDSLEARYFEKFATTGEPADMLPKLVYAPDAAEAKIPGELSLSLYNRSPLDALALVAAAAGCRMEPIPSLPESSEDSKKPQKVVGYYVTVASRPVDRPVQETKPIAPNSAGFITITPEQALPPSVTPLPPPLVKVVEPLVDTFTFTNVEARPPAFAANTLPAQSPGSVVNADSAVMGGMPPAPAPTGPLVRIYPIGFFIKGDENPDQLGKKQMALEQVIAEALQHAKLDDKDGPLLSLHEATKILIVKASAAQHEIVQQIITSLKENEQASAQGTGTLPR